MQGNLLYRSPELQRDLLNGPQPELHLIRPCKLNDGILNLSDKEREQAIQDFTQTDKTAGYFIPASGSGSRMFQFLFEFLDNPNTGNGSMVERFINHIEEFACFYQLPEEVRQPLLAGKMELESFASFILNNHGYGLAHLPKALIPFHKFGPFLLSPIHEHVLQGTEVIGKDCHFHFTIQEKFKEFINENLVFLEGLTSRKFHVEYSCQDPKSNAIAYDQHLNPVLDEAGTLVTRPAGHGALLANFSGLNLDMVFIKNIDNIQHYAKANEAIDTQKMLGGLFIQVQNEIQHLLNDFSEDAWQAFNKKYQLYSPVTDTYSVEQKKALLVRPLRVCGMVKNEGQPGGGPFWIQDENGISKQIVEKAQISPTAEQVRIMVQSSHFNPVMMVCQGRSQDGTPIDFEKFRDDKAYFKVSKTQQGKQIQFTELPGLWNGSMAGWNSIFVEISSETFSPVKTLLDLLEKAHKA